MKQLFFSILLCLWQTSFSQSILWSNDFSNSSNWITGNDIYINQSGPWNWSITSTSSNLVGNMGTWIENNITVRRVTDEDFKQWQRDYKLKQILK